MVSLSLPLLSLWWVQLAFRCLADRLTVVAHPQSPRSPGDRPPTGVRKCSLVAIGYQSDRPSALAQRTVRHTVCTEDTAVCTEDNTVCTEDTFTATTKFRRYLLHHGTAVIHNVVFSLRHGTAVIQFRVLTSPWRRSAAALSTRPYVSSCSDGWPL